MVASKLSSSRRWIPGRMIVFLILTIMGITVSQAGPREQAKRIHDRLAGTPPSAAVLDSMAAKIVASDALGAAFEAMDNPAFYNSTVKDFATPWTNAGQTIFADFNDFTATVVGIVRDDISFQEVLTGDIIYTGSAAALPDTPYSHTDNDHYRELEANRVDLSDPANLVRTEQSSIPDSVLSPAETAGVMTTRTFAEAFLVAGTNRAAVRFASLNFMCGDMEDFRDITRPVDRIRQDVARSPGGDSAIFLNDCVSCHSGLDPLSGAFAYYDFDEELERLAYDATEVQPKFLKDANAFPWGYVTTNDNWANYWRVGPNSALGWNSGLPASGNGAKSFGAELAGSRAFSECQVSKVMQKVCLREPSGAADNAELQRIANVFESSGYSMQRVFAESAVYCMGE